MSERASKRSKSRVSKKSTRTKKEEEEEREESRQNDSVKASEKSKRSKSKKSDAKSRRSTRKDQDEPKEVSEDKSARKSRSQRRSASKKDIDSHHSDVEEEIEKEELTPQQKEEKKKRLKNADKFKKYLNKTGLPLAFQVIFAEVLAKGIKEENVFSYTAMRLRQIGNDIIQILKTNCQPIFQVLTEVTEQTYRQKRLKMYNLKEKFKNFKFDAKTIMSQNTIDYYKQIRKLSQTFKSPENNPMRNYTVCNERVLNSKQKRWIENQQKLGQGKNNFANMDTTAKKIKDDNCQEQDQNHNLTDRVQKENIIQDLSRKLNFLDATDSKIKNNKETGTRLGSIQEGVGYADSANNMSVLIPSQFSFITPRNKGIKISTPTAAMKEKKLSRRLGSQAKCTKQDFFGFKEDKPYRNSQFQSNLMSIAKKGLEKGLTLSSSFKRVCGNFREDSDKNNGITAPQNTQNSKRMLYEQIQNDSQSFRESQIPSLELVDARKNTFKFAIFNDDDLGLPRDIQCQIIESVSIKTQY